MTRLSRIGPLACPRLIRKGQTGRSVLLFIAISASFAQAPELVSVVSKPLSRTADLPGEFEPFQITTIHARVAGFVEKVLVDRGANVKQGQLLAELSAP